MECASVIPSLAVFFFFFFDSPDVLHVVLNSIHSPAWILNASLLNAPPCPPCELSVMLLFLNCLADGTLVELIIPGVSVEQLFLGFSSRLKASETPLLQR